MIENDLIITVLGEVQLGSAGHAPANVGVICSGIHVSCPVNGGEPGAIRAKDFPQSIRILPN